MPSSNPSSPTPTAQVVRLFPETPAAMHATLSIEDQGDLTAAELRTVRQAVIGMPLPWFEAGAQQTADASRDRPWDFSYIRQIAGPFIANFTITRDGTEFTVRLDDCQHTVDEWDGFLTIADAVAVIGYYVEWVLVDWGLRVA